MAVLAGDRQDMPKRSWPFTRPDLMEKQKIQRAAVILYVSGCAVYWAAQSSIAWAGSPDLVSWLKASAYLAITSVWWPLFALYSIPRSY